MPLTPEQQQELQELDELEQLEKQFSNKPSAAPQARPAQAALEGFGQTASMGYLPQLQAGAENAVNNAQRLTGLGAGGADAKLEEQGFQLPERDYVQMRDENIARQKQLAEKNPVASMAGKGAGIVASMAATPGASLLKGVSGVGGAVARGMAQGALQGAAYNPGDTKGVVDSTQFGDRAIGAGVGGLAGGAIGLMGGAVSSLSKGQKMIDRIKDSAGISKSVKGEIDGALSNVTKNVIIPRAGALKRLLQGKQIAINPDRLRGVSRGLNAYADRLAKRANIEGRAVVDANKAQRLKQLLTDRADYNAGKTFDVSATAKQEGAEKAGGIVRRKLAELDPGVDKLNAEMGEAIRLRGAISKKAQSSPVSALEGDPGTDKGSVISSVDKMAGSDLVGLSTRIDRSKKLLMDPTNFLKPLLIANEARKVGTRAAFKAGDLVNSSLPKESLRDALQLINESRRK